MEVERQPNIQASSRSYTSLIRGELKNVGLSSIEGPLAGRRRVPASPTPSESVAGVCSKRDVSIGSPPPAFSTAAAAADAAAL